MDQRELLDLIRAERGDWDTLVDSLEPDQIDVAGVSGAWSVKDIIAHITWFEREMVGLLRVRALVGSELWQFSPDRRNEAVYQRNRYRPLDDVLADAAQVREELLGELQLLEDRDLVDPERFPGMPGDWKPWKVIAGNTFEHYRDHRHDVQTWLAKEA